MGFFAQLFKEGKDAYEKSYKESYQKTLLALQKELPNNKKLDDEKPKKQERNNEWLRNIIKYFTEEHSSVLARKRRQLIVKDDYGNVDNSKWKKEVDYFFLKVISPKLDKNLNLYETLNQDEIFNLINDLVKENLGQNSKKFDPNINPIDYEHFCADLLKDYGWEAKITQATGDQGVDVIVSKHGQIGAIQCKKYSSPVGNKAVQEVYAAMGYIGADFCAVVTNAGYTKSAKQLAQSLNVLLLHHDDLKFLDALVHKLTKDPSN